MSWEVRAIFPEAVLKAHFDESCILPEWRNVTKFDQWYLAILYQLLHYLPSQSQYDITIINLIKMLLGVCIFLTC